MKSLSYKKLRIDDLKLPENWAVYQADPDTEILRGSVDALVQLAPVVVRVTDNLLLAGRKRVAALQELGRATVDCHIVDCSDAEVPLIEAAENYHRKSYKAIDRKEKLAALVTAFEGLYEDDKPDGMPGRPVTAKGKARKAVAKMTGLTERTISRAETDARNKGRMRGIKLLGMEVEEDWAARAMDRRTRMYNAKGNLSMALSNLNAIQDARRGKMARIIEDLDRVYNLVRDNVPKSICPYCKGVSEISSQCGACGGVEVVGKAALQSIDERLLDDENIVVMHKGKMVPIGKFFNEPEPDPSTLEREPDDEPDRDAIDDEVDDWMAGLGDDD